MELITQNDLAGIVFLKLLLMELNLLLKIILNLVKIHFIKCVGILDQPGTHQYATDINWANVNAEGLKYLYDQINSVGKYFEIPVFNQ